jgi:hypothetical protein
VFLFKLVRRDGTPADPPMLRAAVPNWRAGDQIPLDSRRSLRVVAVRDDDADQPPALVSRTCPNERLARSHRRV